MKHYEVLFIVKPTLTEEEVAAKLAFVGDVIAKNGGEVVKVVEMGTRKLAYKIDKYERGVYFVIYFKAPAALVAELTRNLRITEDIIRFLLVKYESKREIVAWEKLVKGLKLYVGVSRRERKPRDGALGEAQPQSEPEQDAQPQE